jgi:hypothetical protein
MDAGTALKGVHLTSRPLLLTLSRGNCLYRDCSLPNAVNRVSFGCNDELVGSLKGVRCKVFQVFALTFQLS